MKFSSFATFAGLTALAAASPDYTIAYTGDVVCTDQTTTVTETQTVTLVGGNQLPTNTYSHTKPPMVITSGGVVTSIDYGYHDQSTVYVYPTGDGKKDITKVIYEGIIIIEVVVINIDITVINGATQTVTTTVNNPPASIPPPGTSSTSTATASSPAQTHLVQVGVAGELMYGPNQLNASLGDIVRFEFLKLNHTVTQSSFAEPCTKIGGGFDSGFNFFNPNNVTDSGTFTTDFIVNTTSPLWFYCRQSVPKSHCHAGMVLGVNPGNKFAQFLANAEAQNVQAKRDHVRRSEPVALKWTA